MAPSLDLTACNIGGTVAVLVLHMFSPDQSRLVEIGKALEKGKDRLHDPRGMLLDNQEAAVDRPGSVVVDSLGDFSKPKPRNTIGFHANEGINQRTLGNNRI